MLQVILVTFIVYIMKDFVLKDYSGLIDNYRVNIKLNKRQFSGCITKVCVYWISFGFYWGFIRVTSYSCAGEEDFFLNYFCCIVCDE